jgi:hypothetical protein
LRVWLSICLLMNRGKSCLSMLSCGFWDEEDATGVIMSDITLTRKALTRADFRYWQILLQKSKIERLGNLADFSAAASLSTPLRRSVIDFG